MVDPKETSADIQEEIGLLRDKAENLLAAASLPLPPHIHMEGLMHGLGEMREKLSELYNDMEQNK